MTQLQLKLSLKARTNTTTVTATTLAALGVVGFTAPANATANLVTIDENLSYDSGNSTDITLDGGTLAYYEKVAVPQFSFSAEYNTSANTELINNAKSAGVYVSGDTGTTAISPDYNYDSTVGDGIVTHSGAVSSGISYISIEFQNSAGNEEYGYASLDPNGGLESITYQPYSASSAVPEPASWAMLIGGFGVVGAAKRRRRRTVALAA